MRSSWETEGAVGSGSSQTWTRQTWGTWKPVRWGGAQGYLELVWFPCMDVQRLQSQVTTVGKQEFLRRRPEQTYWIHICVVTLGPLVKGSPSPWQMETVGETGWFPWGVMGVHAVGALRVFLPSQGRCISLPDLLEDHPQPSTATPQGSWNSRKSLLRSIFLPYLRHGYKFTYGRSTSTIGNT